MAQYQAARQTEMARRAAQNGPAVPSESDVAGMLGNPAKP